MSFSAATCITEVGPQPLGESIEIYTDVDSYSTVLSAVTLSQLTTNCPLLIEVPDGTTKLKVFDPETTCFYIITLQSNDICGDCELGFDSVDNNQISTILIGNLTGSCENPITDYRIEWYGPDSSTNLAFTSGYGTEFPHSINHPITTSSPDAPLLLQGEYLIRLTNVTVNGVNFSYSGQTGTVPSNSLFDCFDLIDVDGVEIPAINVNAYTCDNGGGPYNTYYEHQKSFTTTGDGSIPKALGATFSLSADTESFVWEFQGNTVYDTIKLIFSGSAYSTPILLEEIKIGDVGTNITPTTWPKSYDTTGFFQKITLLTNLTVNENDSIILTVTPNPDNTATSWSCRFGCYGTPTIGKTCLDTFQNSPYKIQASSITGYTVDTCDTYNVSFNVSGCSTADNSDFFGSTIYGLTSNSFQSQGVISTNNSTRLSLVTLGNFYESRPIVQNCGPGRGNTCISTGGTITIKKLTVNQFEFTFSEEDAQLAYYNSYINGVAAISSPSNCGPYVNDDTNIGYYKFVTLSIPDNPGYTLCGDGVSFTDYWLHISSVATLGTSIDGYTMTLTTPLITDNYPITSCLSNSGQFASYVSSANYTRNTIGIDITTTSGLRKVSPVVDTNGCKIGSSGNSTSASGNGTLTVYPYYSQVTYPATGYTNTLVPSLSAETWDWSNHFNSISYSQLYQKVYDYQVVITDFTTDPIQFKINAKQISNWDAIGSYFEVYDSTNPSGFDPVYVY